MDILVLGLLILTISLFAYHSYGRNHKNIFVPIYYFLAGYFYVYIVEYLVYRNLLIEIFGEVHSIFSLLAVWLSIVVFYFAYHSKYTKKIAARLPVPIGRWQPGHLIPYGIFLIVIGIVGYYIFIRQSGGLIEFLSEPRGKGAYEASTAYLYGARWLLSPALAILIVESARIQKARLLKLLIIIASVCYFAFQIWIGQRAGVVNVGALLLASYYLPKRRFRKINLKKLFLAILIIVIGAGFVSAFRSELYIGSSFEEINKFLEKPVPTMLSDLLSAIVTGGGSSWYTSEITMFMNFMRIIPQYVAFDYGVYYFDFLTVWIPRLLWPGKPYLGLQKKVELEQLIGTSHLSGPSVTMLGMYYLHFGFLGIVVGCLLTGLIFGTLERWMKQNENNYGVLLIYLMLFQNGIDSVMGNGFFSGIVFTVPFLVLPMLGSFIYLRLRYRKYYEKNNFGIRQFKDE